MKLSPNRDTHRDKISGSARQFVLRTKVGTLTPTQIKNLRPGAKRTDGWLSGGDGRLVVRVRTARGSTVREFAYRWHDPDGTERLLTLGAFPALSLKDARQQASDLSKVRAAGGDPRQHVEQQQLDRERKAAEKRASGTFGELLDAYVLALRDAGKSSAKDVEQALLRHVRKPFRRLIGRSASDITPDDVVQILAKMIAAGVRRRANLVRSHLHAAFAQAVKSDLDPRQAAFGRSTFRLTANPVRDVPRQMDFDRAGDRVLDDAELRNYWRALEARTDPIAAAAKVGLLLGGQRLAQLLRVEWVDYDSAAGTIMLRDPKGRGGGRDHVLPVSSRVAACIPAKHPDGGPFIFTTGAGRPIHLTTLSSEVSKIAATIVKRGEPFTARDLRRTVETRLAALGVTKETRGQVLSHGLKRGVQEKHYDRHHYLSEKKAALDVWQAHLVALTTEPEPEPAQVQKGQVQATKGRPRLRLVA